MDLSSNLLSVISDSIVCFLFFFFGVLIFLDKIESFALYIQSIWTRNRFLSLEKPLIEI